MLIYFLLLHIRLFIVLTLWSKQECTVYSFLPFLKAKPLHVFCFAFLFSFSTISNILHHFLIDFIFNPASCSPSGPSLHLLTLSFTGGRSDLFQSCWLCFLGSPLWPYVRPFWTYILISSLINVVISIVYFSVRSLLVTCLNQYIVL